MFKQLQSTAITFVVVIIILAVVLTACQMPIQLDDFGLLIPSVPFIASVSNEVKLRASIYGGCGRVAFW